MTDVSVVIATYRRREPLRAAIQSVLDQTLPVAEVLVCDDATDDGSVEMVREWAAREPRLRHVPAPVHAGRPAPPRNRGLRAARSPWVAFLDDDDIWTPDKLERQSPWLNDDADLVCANAQASDGERYFPDWTQPRRFGAATLRRTNPVVLSTAVGRRDALLAAGGFPEEPWLAGVEDYALWLAVVLEGGRFVALAEPLARYERHSEGTGRLSMRIVANQFAIARWLWRLSRTHADPACRRAAFRRGAYALTIARDRWSGWRLP